MDTRGKGKYYITSDSYENDAKLAEALKTTYKEYANHIIKEFNGYVDTIGYSDFKIAICFENIQDAARAVEYIESLLVANKLSQ